MSYIQRYKPFFSMLPEVLCDSEMVLDEYTCWNGEDVVERYDVWFQNLSWLFNHNVTQSHLLNVLILTCYCSLVTNNTRTGIFNAPHNWAKNCVIINEVTYFYENLFTL